MTREEAEDTISRKAVLKVIDGWYDNNRYTENIEDLIVLITYMSSVQPISRDVKALGEEMRICQSAIKDEKVLLGFNIAVALCNKHLADMRDTERLCDTCKYKGASMNIEMTTFTRCHNPKVSVHYDNEKCEFYERGAE